MLAVGLGTEAVKSFLEKHKGGAWIACFNSPNSVTISGKLVALEALRDDIQAAGHFARLLQVDLAYHSRFMDSIGEEYEQLLSASNFATLGGSADVSMFSSVTGSKKTGTADALYWKTNMVSPVRFDEAVTAMLSEDDAPNFLIELGPSGALAGPVAQIKKSLPNQGADVAYCAAWSRGVDAGKSLFDAAGRLFVAGGPVDLAKVNEYSEGDSTLPSTIIDLPNYVWDHSIKYWHENEASKDWRFKKHITHDLLGSKVLGTSWRAPSWRKHLSLANVPWLRDHKMGPDVLMPGSGFIAMALEALYQKKQAVDPDPDGAVKSANDLSYRFRNVRFDKALVLEEEKEAVLLLSLARQVGTADWHEFRISSLVGSDNTVVEHCSGLVRDQHPVEKTLAEEGPRAHSPLEHPVSAQLWYKSQAEVGYGFGPAFQRVLQVESTSGQRNCRSSVSLTEPKSKWSPQSYYPIHPASLDGCFQTVTPSLWAGERSSMNAVLVPSIIDDLVINRVPTGLKEGLSVASSEYSGRGRLEEGKSYFSNCSVYDPSSGALLVQLSGLRFAKLDTGLKPDPHTFDRVSWKPDISFLHQEHLDSLPADTPAAKIDLVVDLIAHKNPALRVLEINLDATDTSSLWFDAGDSASRAAYLEYHFGSPDARATVAAQTKHEGRRDSLFHVLNPAKEAFGLPVSESAFDLVIVQVSEVAELGTDGLVKTLTPLLVNGSRVLFVQRKEATQGAESSSSGDSTPDSPGTPGTLEALTQALEHRPDTPASSVSDVSASENLEKVEGLQKVTVSVQETEVEIHETQDLASDVDTAVERYLWDLSTLKSIISSHDFGESLEINTSGNDTSAYLFTFGTELKTNARPLRDLHVVRLANPAPALDPNLGALLHTSGWNITEQTHTFSNLTPGSTVLVLDELYTPVLTQITPDQWDSLKTLLTSGTNLLWVTQGSQHEVTNPDTALAHGLFRVVRREDPSIKVTTLDVESSTNSTTTGQAIADVLEKLTTTKRAAGLVETEFAERGGIVYVHRVVPDGPVNGFRRDEREGTEPVLRELHGVEAAVALRAERLGTFQGLTWSETGVSEVPVEADRVEVEVFAAGVNFKVSSAAFSSFILGRDKTTHC